MNNDFMPDLENVLIASLTVLTIGSPLRLKDVFKTPGIPEML